MNERSDNNHSTPRPPVGAEPVAGARAVSLQDRVRSLRLPANQARAAAPASRLPWVFCLLLAGASAYLGYRAYVAEPQADAEKPTGVQPAVSEPSAAFEKPSGKVALVAGGYV